MRHNKFISATIILCMIALFTVSWKNHSRNFKQPGEVTIIDTYTGGTFPNITGTFTASGAISTSGTVTMHVDVIAPGKVVHCVITLVATDGSGTITIYQECNYVVSPTKGQWHIVDGTGIYSDLKGNGLLMMPPHQDVMTGTIF